MYISIDLGGTNTRVASSKDLKNIHKVEKFPTIQNLKEQKDMVNAAISKVIEGDSVDYICLGVPGMVDREGQVYKKVVNYPQLDGKYFGYFFDMEKSSNVIAENDAALAGLAEANRGEAAKYNTVAYITLSTGVGGVRVSGKQLDRAVDINEPGHMIIVENGILDDVCGQKGCLHAYLSGAMFEKVYGEKPETTDNQEIWKDYGKHLATGVNNIIAMWDPDIIVLGGGISEQFDRFSPEMFKILNDQDLLQIPPILKSELGDTNGLLGGFDLINSVLNQ